LVEDEIFEKMTTKWSYEEKNREIGLKMKISYSNADAWFFALTQKSSFWRKPDKFNLRETELSYTLAKKKI